MQTTTTDSLLLRGTILTMNPAQPMAAALVVDCRAGSIAFVGALSEAREFPGNGKLAELDLGGSFVVPGFNDCHMHVLPYGLDLEKADLSPEAGVKDADSLIAALRQWHASHQDAEWIVGSRYNQNLFPGARHPNRTDLDRAFADRPVYVVQTSKHAAACNSLALRLAGITRATPDPSGGEIVRDASGEPTGVLLETAMEMVSRLLPRPTRAQLTSAASRAVGALWRVGITAASDLNTGWHDVAEEIAAYRAALDAGSDIRLTLFPHAPGLGEPRNLPSRESFAKDHASCLHGNLRLGPVKLFSDGALTVRTAALRHPYADGSGSGMLLHPPEELKAYVLNAHRLGWQIAIHAIGDRAIELVLNSYHEAHSLSGTSPTGNAPRHRIEHAMLLDEALIQRIAQQGVVPVFQPEFISRLGDAYLLALGEERAQRLNPVASLLRRGIRTPFSSDCPIVPGAPLDGMRAAVRRVTASGRTLGASERISPEEALRNYTWSAAYSTHDEMKTGFLAPGMRADLAVLSHDPRTEHGLEQARVLATMVGGKMVYQT